MYYLMKMPRRSLFNFVKYLIFPIIGFLFIIINYFTMRILITDHWSNQHNLISDVIADKPFSRISLSQSCNSNLVLERTVWLRKKQAKNSSFTHIVNAFKNYHYTILGTNYSIKLNETKWNVMWSHNYPFTNLRTFIINLKNVHCINQYPGSGFITNKVSLVTSNFTFIPRAFKIPYEKQKLLEYSKNHPNTMFVQKSSDHRGIKIKKLENLHLDITDSFIQEFIHNPLLIDGYKFDIGVYVVITSVKPLRVYMFEGEVLFRFCPEKYHPFSADNPDKYVVGDDYLPTWKVPSLSQLYQDQQLGMKGSFDAWLRSTNKDPNKIWRDVRQAIRDIFIAKEEMIIKAVDNYPKKIRFFELMRFDFIINDVLKVFLMEANMSPNLSSAHFKQNRLLYEQVVFNVLALAGVNNGLCSGALSKEDINMRVASKDISTFPDHCSRNCILKEEDCKETHCQLCNICLSVEDRRNLESAFLEHITRGMSKRLLPPPIDHKSSKDPIDTSNLSPENTLMVEWFRGKCLLDKAFCN